MDPIRNEPFAAYIEARLDGLKPSERRAAAYVLREPRRVLFASADEIGAGAGTSDATVIRMAKALGYSGLPELKRHASQQVAEQIAPSERLGTEIARSVSLGDDRVARLADDVIDSIETTKQNLESEGLARAASLMLGARAVHTWGVGASGIAAEYAALRLRRVGVDARWMSASGFKLADELLSIRADDVVLVFVPGRHHSDLDAVVDRMAEKSAHGVLVTSALGRDVRDRFDVTFRADNATSKLAGELYSSMWVTDALIVELANRQQAKTLETSDSLTRLRARFG